MKKDQKISKGDFLVSEPFMVDGNFKKTVVFLTEYDPDNGAIGFIINRQLQYFVHDLLSDFPEFDSPVYFGGPVATNTIHYLHTAGDRLEDSIEVVKGIYWGGNFEKLRFLVDNKLISPDEIRFFVGYSGWAPGQLEEEMRHGSWIIAPSEPDYIFNMPDKDIWKKVLENKGDMYKIIAEIPDNYVLN